MCVLRNTRMMCTSINVRLYNGMDVRSSSSVRMYACGRHTEYAFEHWYIHWCVHTLSVCLCACVSVLLYVLTAQFDVHVWCLACNCLSMCVSECAYVWVCLCVSAVLMRSHLCYSMSYLNQQTYAMVKRSAVLWMNRGIKCSCNCVWQCDGALSIEITTNMITTEYDESKAKKHKNKHKQKLNSSSNSSSSKSTAQ